MGVFRVNKNKNYTVMSNVHLRDKALPLKAKGLLSLMLSLPEDWDYSMRGLAKLSADGLDSTRAAVKALERSGYVVRRQLYDSRGRFSNNEYTVFEIPQPSSPSSDLPLTGKPSTEKSPSDAPLSEKPSQINTDQVITQKRNTDLNNYQSINLDGMDRMDERSEYEEIIKENLDYDILCQDPKFDKDRFREIMDIMLDAVCSTAPTIRINGEDMPQQVVKQSIKKEYAAARNAGSQTAGTATKNTGKKLGEKVSDKIKEFFENNKKVFIWIGVGIALLVLLGAGISSCSMLTSTGSSVIASSYLSEDDAVLGAEAQYCQMEQELQRYLDTYESTHNYDEYHFDLDDIEHDPYVLISILSALHEGEFTLDEVQGTLQMLFEKQYILTEEVIVETRYRTETDTWTDADGNTHTETYRVPYDYYICNVKLENFNLSHVPVYIMSQEQLSMYATYMSVLGNREDLFGDSPYVDKYITNPPADYDVNPEYLADEKFATLIAEAEKYLGYPYVWGGSNPDTSFDCSGFVSYVLTNSGLVNTGRLGAQGLYNISTPVSKANAQPGDLIFFVGTYDTPGVSHVGIYVGDGVMIHCGDPIQYTSINSSYWQQHFYAFGRPAY